MLIKNSRLFSIFVEKLLGFRFLKDPGSRDSDGAPRKRPVFGEDDCLEIATYYFQTLLNILRYATTGIMAQLEKEMVVNGDERKAQALLQCKYPSGQRFFLFIILHSAALRPWPI
jgi:hypothetical protein